MSFSGYKHANLYRKFEKHLIVNRLSAAIFQSK